MAYVHSSNTSDSNNSTVSELTVDLPTYDSGDLVVVFIESSHTSAVFQQKTGTTGWTKYFNTSYVYGDRSFAIFYKFVGASEATPVFNEASSNTGYMTAISTTVKGAHATTPIVTHSEDRADVSKTFTMPTIDTTGYDDCLILAFGGSISYSRALAFSPSVTHYSSFTYNSHAVVAAWFYQETAGVSPAINMFKANGTTDQVGKLLIAIQDDGTGSIKGGVLPSTQPAELVQACFPGHVSGSNVTSLITNLDGDASVNKGFGTEESNPFLNVDSYPWVLQYVSNSTNPNLTGATFYDSTQDLTDSLLSFSMAPRTYDDSKPYATGGRYFGLISGSDAAAKLWKIESKDSVLRVKSGNFPYIVDTSVTAYDSFGAFDVTDVTKWVFGINRNGTSANILGYLYKLGTMVMTYGNSSNPCSFSDAARHANTSSLRSVQSQGGQAFAQFYISQNIQIGNSGTGSVYWQSANQSVEFPSAYDTASRFIHHQISQSRLSLTVAGASGDTIDLSSCTLNFGDYHNFVLNSSVAVDTDGLVILNADVTLTNNGSTALSGITFSSCKELPVFDLSGGNIIANCVDAQATTVTNQTDFQKFANCTFRDNTVGIKITGNQTGSWSDPSLTVSGNTYDIEYTGSTDFSIQSATSLSVNNSGTGTLTIVTPTTTFTINSSETGSLIQIFTTGTQTLLDSTTGSSLAYTYTGTVVVDYVVQKAGFLPQRFTGVTLTDSTVSVVLESDPVYDSGHGLTYTTDFSYNRSTKKLTLSTRQEGRDFYSALIDAFIAQTSLRNTAFDFKAVGPDSIFFLDDAEIIDTASEDNWKGAGIRYLNSSDVVTAEWSSIKSSGTIPAGATGEYQQQDGAGTTDLRTTGAVDQIIKTYGDATHGNFDYRGHLVIKYQVNGYREVRADVLDLAGVATLEPFEYSIAMEPVAISATTGDPAISITVTDHGASPVTWNGKQFSITVQYSGADSGEDILRELNYNLSLDTTYQGKDPFNWPEMVIEAGSAYETLRGITEGGTGASLKGVRVVNASSDPHPDFTRFQADDGTYYTVPVTANGSITGIVSGSRVRIYNETTATETYNDVPGTSYAVSYTDGTTYSSGDVIKIYITQTSGTTAKLPFTTTVVASSSGWSALADQEDDTVYNQYAINGSAVTKFSADYTNDEVDLIVASNFAADEFYAWWCYNLTTSQGIADFFGGVTAQDAANLRINNATVNIYWDNTTTTNVYQTDNIRIYRADDAYPVRNPTSGGGGIDVVWRDRVYIAVTGSGVTAQDKTDIKNLVFDEVIEGTETFKQQMKLVRAEAVGELAVSGDTVTIRDAGDTKDRITATVDANGQRTSVTVDAS